MDARRERLAAALMLDLALAPASATLVADAVDELVRARLAGEREETDAALMAYAATLRAEIRREVDALTARVDDVHSHALRAITALLERSPTR